MTVVEKDVVVNNPHGVHGRVATRLAVIARQKGIVMQLLHEGRYIDCASVLDVLSMAFTCGSMFRVRIEGKENEVRVALRAVEKIFAGETGP